MSNPTQRIESANLVAARVGAGFFENGGNLIVERPGDTSVTTASRVQKDLGPLTGCVYTSWCLDAATGVIETDTAPTQEFKNLILRDTGFVYPEAPFSATGTPIIAPLSAFPTFAAAVPAASIVTDSVATETIALS